MEALLQDGMSKNQAYKIMLREYPDILTIDQMSEILGISTKTGYKLLTEKKIECKKVGRAYRIPKINLLTYFKIGSGNEKSVQ